MAGIKISDLPAAPSAQLTDVFPIDQLPGPVTYKLSISQLTDLIGSGTVNPGTINQVAYYAATGDIVSGLATANNGILVTSATGVPSIGNSVGADLTIHNVTAGLGGSSIATNTAFGAGALAANTSGSTNVAIGYVAMNAHTSGTGNVAIGYQASASSNGTSNISIGQFTTTSITGQKNTVIGSLALQSATTCSNNVAIGDHAGGASVIGGVPITTGGNNTFIGMNSGANNAAAIGTLAIGLGAIADIATGSTSADNGPGIAIGSASAKIGFRGNGTIYPSTTGSGFWRTKINGTYYQQLLFPDGSTGPGILPIANGGTAKASFTAYAPVFGGTTSTGALQQTAALTNGQLTIGSTGALPVAATLTAGPGISIANGAGSITVSGTGSGIGWTEVTGTTQAIVADNGYVANNAGLVTFTLPTTAAFGTVVNVVGKGAGGWKINQNASQIVRIGSAATTSGVGGSIASTNRYDSIELLCTTANTTWTALGGPQGIITIV